MGAIPDASMSVGPTVGKLVYLRRGGDTLYVLEYSLWALLLYERAF